jgi:hypothetical protein
VEQHGPHCLLGCDTYNALGGAVELAKASGGIVFPEVPYCWIGGLRAFSGTINLRSRNFVHYLREVVISAHRTGFRRIVIVNCHGGNFYTMRVFARDMWKDDGIPVICLRGVPAGPGRGRGAGEASGMCGGLLILGHPELVEKVRRANEETAVRYANTERGPEPASLRGTRRLGLVGFDYFAENEHVQPGESFEPEVAVRNFEEAGRFTAKLLEDLKTLLAEREKSGR